MTKPIFAAAVCLWIGAGCAQAETPDHETCRAVTALDDDVITIEASPNHATHLILPERIVTDVPGNSALWQLHAYDAHYWIKPGDADTADGAGTTLTLITASRSYEFVVKRVSTLATPCVRINDPPLLGTGVVSVAPVALPENAAPTLHTRYAWRGDLVDSVYDDGRRTFVRIARAGQGNELPVLSGGTKKHPELINASFDEATQTFVVAGIHDSLLLADHSSKTTITRRD